MEQITLRLPARLLAELERDARDAGRTRSEHIRGILESHRETQRAREACKDEIDELEKTVDRLRNEKRILVEAMQDRDRTEELVRYVEERERAGLVTRAKLWLFGPD